ncbi:MAG: TolC family protein [Nitrospiraceae bacterium]|nr:TolC family protein [Nitrospiraceae bacterium]MSR24566.1 TolC family protein [Nitrospiraceae bacterium]
MRAKLSIHMLMVSVAVTAGLWGAGLSWSATTDEKASMAQKPSPSALRLSQDEAVALFLRQNFDLLISRFGIEYAKGQQITARLFPNPVLSVGTQSSFTQVCQGSVSKCGQVFPQIQQLFEMAGKRGYRMESASFGARSAEANFEDAIRQLSFTVKDAYYRVQLAQRRLALAEENRDRFSRILEVNTIRFKKGYIAEVDLIRIRLQVVDFQSQIIQAIQDGNQARADLRVLLGLSPSVDVMLTTQLDYHLVEPDIVALRRLALETRPDIRMKRLMQSQRMADLRLAKAYRIPDITAGAGYAVQGPQGPDNQQQVALSLGIPLPLFNRNQGGIAQAEVSTQVADADLQKAIVQVENDVEIAYRNMLESRRLVETYRGGVLEDARLTLTIVEKAYERGGATILDLLDAGRTSRTIQQNYIETLFNYQRNLFLLENAVGREISS